MFGGIERGSGRSFLALVESRDAATLLPILQEYVLPGTQVMSDLWRSYGGIAELPEGYGHLTINHSVNFVDPVSGAHTQNVENMWMRYKRKVKSSMGLNTPTSDRYNDYLQELTTFKNSSGGRLLKKNRKFSSIYGAKFPRSTRASISLIYAPNMCS